MHGAVSKFVAALELVVKDNLATPGLDLATQRRCSGSDLLGAIDDNACTDRIADHLHGIAMSHVPCWPRV